MYNGNVECNDKTHQTAHKHSRIRSDSDVPTKLQELKWPYYRVILYVKGKVLDKGVDQFNTSWQVLRLREEVAVFECEG